MQPSWNWGSRWLTRLLTDASLPEQQVGTGHRANLMNLAPMLAWASRPIIGARLARVNVDRPRRPYRGLFAPSGPSHRAR